MAGTSGHKGDGFGNESSEQIADIYHFSHNEYCRVLCDIVFQSARAENGQAENDLVIWFSH